MTPNFLRNAKRFEHESENKNLDRDSAIVDQNVQEQAKGTPSFLSRAKPLKEVQEQAIDQSTQSPKQNYISDEDIERDIERNQARSFSRIGESLLGAPGDISSFLLGLFGKEQNILPTSEKLRGVSEKLTGGYTKPQSEIEEKGDEFFSDIGSMLTPGAGKYNLIRNLGIPLVGSLVKEGFKYADQDEENASAAKIGTMIGLDLIAHRGLGGVKKFSGNLFKQAEQAIPEGSSMNAKNLQASLISLEDNLKKGGSRPSTERALKKIKEIKKDIHNDSVDIKKLVAYRPSINELIDELGGFEIQLPKKIRQRAIGNLNDVKRTVINGLEEYGKAQNPEFLKLHKAANESWAAYENSNKIAKFLKKHVGAVKNPATKAVLGLLPVGAGAAYASPMGALIGAGATGAAAGGYQGFKIFHRVMNSPTLRNYYFNILNGSIAGNTPQVIKNLKNLDNDIDDNE